MKEKIKKALHWICIIGVLVVAIIVLLAVYNRKIDKIREEADHDAQIKAEMEQQVKDALAEKDIAIKEKSKFAKAAEEAEEKIKELLIEETIVLDAGTLEESLLEVQELATMSYCYSNYGALDADKDLKNTKINLSLLDKQAVIMMEGVIKAGVKLDKVKIDIDEDNKEILVTMPDAEILSNELFEDSLQVVAERDGLFDKVTIEDDSTIRAEIKEKAVKRATEQNILGQAKENAQKVIAGFLNVNPAIKDNYTITFK